MRVPARKPRRPARTNAEEKPLRWLRSGRMPFTLLPDVGAAPVITDGDTQSMIADGFGALAAALHGGGYHCIGNYLQRISRQLYEQLDTAGAIAAWASEVPHLDAVRLIAYIEFGTVDDTVLSEGTLAEGALTEFTWG